MFQLFDHQMLNTKNNILRYWTAEMHASSDYYFHNVLSSAARHEYRNFELTCRYGRQRNLQERFHLLAPALLQLPALSQHFAERLSW